MQSESNHLSPILTLLSFFLSFFGLMPLGQFFTDFYNHPPQSTILHPLAKCQNPIDKWICANLSASNCSLEQEGERVSEFICTPNDVDDELLFYYCFPSRPSQAAKYFHRKKPKPAPQTLSKTNECRQTSVVT